VALTFKEWLKHKLIGMVSIQAAGIRDKPDEPDIIALAWSGMRLHIHLIGQPPRTRTLKRILQNTSEIGVSTMFLVDGRILPEDGKRTEAKDWVKALHELNHERVYAYRVQNGGAEIIPIHFEEIPGSNELKAWYGPTVTFERLRFLRTAVKHPRSLRGEWLVADFDNRAFWKNTDYRAYQERLDREYAYSRQTRWQTWSTGETWKKGQQNGQRSNGNRIRSPLQQRLDDCYQLLGVEKSASHTEVKRAYRQLAITYHPDTSEMPTEKAQAAFQALNDAYDYVKAANGWS